MPPLPLGVPPVQPPCSIQRLSQDSEVWMALTTTDVGNVTQDQGVVDHQVLPISGAQHAQAFCHLATHLGNFARSKAGKKPCQITPLSKCSKPGQTSIGSSCSKQPCNFCQDQSAQIILASFARFKVLKSCCKFREGGIAQSTLASFAMVKFLKAPKQTLPR